MTEDEVAFSLIVYGVSLLGMLGISGSVKGFYKARPLHAAHAVVTCGLVIGNMDLAALAFSTAYFTLELPSCVLAQDAVFTAHALLSLTLLPFGFMEPWLSRRAARFLLVELSTPLYHLWKQERKRNVLGAFGVAFFLCRLMLIPYLAFEFSDAGWPLLVVGSFFTLNLGWFYKLWQLYHDYDGQSGTLSICLIGLLPFAYTAVVDSSWIAASVVLNGIMHHAEVTQGWRVPDTISNAWCTAWVVTMCPSPRPMAGIATLVWLVNQEYESDLAHVLGVQFVLWVGLQMYLHHCHLTYF